MTKKVFFDLDGTLVDVSKRDHAIYRHILLENGYSHIEFNNYWMLRREKIDINVLLQQSGCSDDFISNVFLPKRKILDASSDWIMPNDMLFSNVSFVLEKLKSRNCQLFIVTRRTDEILTKKQCEFLNISHFFDEIRATGNNKSLFLKQNSVSPNDLLIGDTEHDILSAHDAKLTSVAISSGIRSKKQLQQYHPDFLFENLVNVLDII